MIAPVRARTFDLPCRASLRCIVATPESICAMLRLGIKEKQLNAGWRDGHGKTLTILAAIQQGMEWKRSPDLVGETADIHHRNHVRETAGSAVMADEARRGVSGESDRNGLSLASEYERCLRTLDALGLLIPLSRTNRLGVIGTDGNEYPVPTREQVTGVFTRNPELVARKATQGFTQLQLTPIALPISLMIDRVRDALLIQAAAGQIFHTKRDPVDANVAARINTAKPIWMWEMVRQAADTADLVYFPHTFSEHDHHGLTKEEAFQNTRCCAVPGWSVALIEPIPVMPSQGTGLMLGGRKQLEACSNEPLEERLCPRDYLRTLSTPGYQGETGWTLEDFLIHFMTQLHTAHQVSHDRSDGNALWLLGSYLPNSDHKGMKSLVLVGYWDRGRLYLTAHRSANRLRSVAARSMVRLPG